MAVIQTIRQLFTADETSEPRIIVPAPDTEYTIKPLTSNQLKEVLRLNMRCFRSGDSYTRHTFAYLLSLPTALSYRVVTSKSEMVAFAFVMITETGAGHLTTIGVAPEHRRRKIAERLLQHTERSLSKRGIATMMLEVRVGNVAAQNLYRSNGYAAVQRIGNYYINGEDCFLMIKPLGGIDDIEV
ncbi:MAG: ribosomal protein S18-alanine N-acetyltransferase [Pyrinomonadaceae bacterium]